MGKLRICFVVIAAAATLGASSRAAHAIVFGQNDAVELRGRVYSQFTVATEQSKLYTQPPIDPGNMKQWRTFYNPELEVDFRKLVGWRSFFDQLSGRLAIWGFYDGLYDFGPERYRQNLAKTKQPGVEAAFYSEGYSYEQALDNTGRRRDGREFYGRRTRVNEAYLNFAKGPAFLRVGRQAISWGEADTIGLLDANNPFDILLTPGVQIDLDEARIPLWTARATYALFSSWGPLSSGFVDAYWVPGWLDTTTGYVPIMGVSPYSQPPPLQGPGLQIFDKHPRYELGNSRYGFKFQTVVNGDYNASLWFYRTFQTVPVPVLAGISDGGKYITTVLNHGLTNVIGGAMSWYSARLDSIVRAELELFNDEPAFLAYKGIGAVVDSGFAPGVRGQYDKVNVLRGEFGIDKNFFLPMINPSASFLAIVDLVFAANFDENSERDYRTPLVKPSAVDRQLHGGPMAGQITPKWCDDKNIDVPPEQRQCDFTNQDPFEAFLQTTIRTDYAGRWQPQLTAIATVRGALLFAPSVLYRYSDSFLFDVKYINTHTFGSGNDGYTQGVGLLRDGDQIWFRATYQLN